MKNKEIRTFSKLILIVNGILLTVVITILLVLKLYSWSIGYLFGSIISYITYLMHVNNVEKIDGNTKNPARKSVASALLRLLISAAILFVALYVEFINFYATFVGLLVIKFTVFIVGFIREIKKSKGGNVETQ